MAPPSLAENAVHTETLSTARYSISLCMLSTSSMLDLAFDAASSGKNNWDTPTLNAIAAIWSVMCADAVLCNKLLERGWSYSRLSEVRWLKLIRMILVGAATRIMKLLPTSISSTVTVRLLALISYHGNESLRIRRIEEVLRGRLSILPLAKPRECLLLYRTVEALMEPSSGLVRMMVSIRHRTTYRAQTNARSAKLSLRTS